MAPDIIFNEIKKLIEDEEEVPAGVARRLLLAVSLKTYDQLLLINGQVKKVKAVAAETAATQKRYPSILWLLYHRTKITVAVIVLVFCLLSLLWIPELRIIILEWLSLPPL